MSLEEIIGKKIREAMERGEFDNLKGQGQPQDHSDYFAAPEDLRMGYAVLRNAGYLPHEAQLLKDIAALKEKLAACTDPEGVRAADLRRRLHDKRLELDILMERRNRRPRPARGS
jgi:hypothetical protein